jgi:ankyrin repeat protein
MKLNLRYGGDIHKLGTSFHQRQHSLLYDYSLGLKGRKDSKFVKLIEFLIEEGVDVNFEGSDGETAFTNCARHGMLELCRLLVKRGADPSVARKGNKKTALHFAAFPGNFANAGI